MNHLNMNEAFRRWPLGMTTYPAWADLYGAMFHEWNGSSVPFDDWLFERLRPLLEAPVTLETKSLGPWIPLGDGVTFAEAIRQVDGGNGFIGPLRLVLDDGTVIREWPIDEYDGIF